MSETCALEFQFPTPQDYRNGGFGELVAQCSCGAFEYVFSRREGAYWHGLHRGRPGAHPHFLLIDSPMPEDWEIPAPTPVADLTKNTRRPPRTYTCPACLGVGSTPAFGAQGGRFYQFGDRVNCDNCDGSGRTDTWAA